MAQDTIQPLHQYPMEGGRLSFSAQVPALGDNNRQDKKFVIFGDNGQAVAEGIPINRTPKTENDVNYDVFLSEEMSLPRGNYRVCFTVDNTMVGNLFPICVHQKILLLQSTKTAIGEVCQLEVRQVSVHVKSLNLYLEEERVPMERINTPGYHYQFVAKKPVHKVLAFFDQKDGSRNCYKVVINEVRAATNSNTTTQLLSECEDLCKEDEEERATTTQN